MTEMADGIATFNRAGNLEEAMIGGDGTGVTNLTTRFGIEAGAVKNGNAASSSGEALSAPDVTNCLSLLIHPRIFVLCVALPLGAVVSWR